MPDAAVVSSVSVCVKVARVRRSQPGDPEIQHLQAAVRRQHHIAGLQIQVNDPGTVGGHERLGELGAEPGHFGRGKRVGPDVAKRLPVDVLDDQEIAPVLLVEIEDCGDIRVVQARKSLRFAAEARPRQLVRDAAIREDFDGHTPS